MQRRDFLKYLNLSALTAFSFGCSIKPLVENKDKRVALIYATRYGATKDTALWIQEAIQRDIDILNIEDISFEKTAQEYDYFILGSGVWIDGVHKDMIRFLETQKVALKDKIIASFILCGTTAKDVKGEARIEKYFHKFHASLEKKPLLNKYFGGRMIIEKLNEKDRILLENFYTKILKREFASWDRTEPKKATLFAQTVQNYM